MLNNKEGVHAPLLFCLYMVKPYRMIVSSLPDHTAGNTDILLIKKCFSLCKYNITNLRYNSATELHNFFDK